MKVKKVKKKMNKFRELEQQMRRVCRRLSWRRAVQTQIINDINDNGIERKKRYKLYTTQHIYSIIACDRDWDEGYLGCTVATRKPLAGEDWNRGSDLADGKFTMGTWIKILEDIVGYELEPISETVLQRNLNDESGVLREV